MKNVIFSVVCLLFISTSAFDQELTGEDIINKVNERLNPKTSHSTVEMTITTTSGDKRTFVFESWSKNKGEKNLVRYIKPRRVKDQATLMLNNANDIWMYFPRTERIRKLATHAKKQKMQGSDFSYEDMGSGDAFIEDYKATRLEDEEIEGYECFKIELNRKPDSDLSYSRVIMWVIKESFYPVVIDYYTEEDSSLLEKRLVQSNIEVIDGIPTAKKAVMHNKLNNTSTEMQILNIEYNLELSDDMFTERNLKR